MIFHKKHEKDLSVCILERIAQKAETKSQTQQY